MSKDSEELNNPNQLDLIGLYRILYPTTAEATFFSRAHESFAKMTIS